MIKVKNKHFDAINKNHYEPIEYLEMELKEYSSTELEEALNIANPQVIENFERIYYFYNGSVLIKKCLCNNLSMPLFSGTIELEKSFINFKDDFDTEIFFEANFVSKIAMLQYFSGGIGCTLSREEYLKICTSISLLQCL